MKGLFVPVCYLYTRKLYSLLNICGLGISLSVCLVLALFVRKELSYEDSFAIAERTYLIGQKVESSSAPVGSPLIAGSSVKVHELFPDAFPEVERVTRAILNTGPEVLFRIGDMELPESGLRYADEEFFRVFDFPVVAGELTTALDRPDALVLTRALAEKLFGTSDVVGRTVTMDGETELVWSIVWLLTNDFSKLVLVSNVIAWPLAYVAMSRWLENFAHRIDLTPLVFIGSGLIALCIAWATVGGTAAKAAIRKPVLALRYE